MKITILGAAGRMGQSLLRCSAKIPGLTIAGAIERPAHPCLEQLVRESDGLHDSPTIPTTLRYSDRWVPAAEAIIDFTFHTCVTANLASACKHRQAYVLGTTGLTKDETATVMAAAKEIPIVWAPNMSLGINLLLELVRRSASVLNTSYDAEIVEMHHRYKKDAPSGTALGLAHALAEGRQVNLEDVACYGREGMPGERPCGEIGIHTLRGGSVVGDHTVMFAADEERIELTHRAVSRDAFSTGALRAALWLQKRAPGLYNMRHVLGFEEA